MSGIFISYAPPDTGIAMRLHNDLTRSGAVAWRYDRDGTGGSDGASAMEEMRRRVRSCTTFLLLDSPASRRSHAVRDEVRAARMIPESGPRRKPPRFLVCAAVQAGPWQLVDELFPEQRSIRATVLVPYDRGIRELCSTLGFEHIPDFGMPQDRDFVDELCALPLHDSVRKRLLGDYAMLGELYRESKLDEAERSLATLIDDCDTRDIAAVTPHLMLGVVRGDLRNDRGAATAFGRATEVAPRDPRGWAALGATLYRTGNYPGAAAAFEECDRWIAFAANQEHRRHWTAVKVGLAAAWTAAGRSREALELLVAVHAAVGDSPRVLSLLGHALLMNGEPKRARTVLQRAEQLLSPDSALAMQTWMDLADSYAALGEQYSERAVLLRAASAYALDAGVRRRLGAHYASMGSIDDAEKCLRHAIRLDPSHLAAQAELALHLLLAGDEHEAHTEASYAVDIEPHTAADHYYSGLALHILGDSAAATVARRVSRRDVVVSRWPDYEELLERDGMRSE